jgi:hypothetical protein
MYVILFDCAGRSKNVWESPAGCLMFSFTIQMEDGQVVPLLQYVVSLAVTEAIKDLCNKNVSFCFLIEVHCQPLPSYNLFISYLISEYRFLGDFFFNQIT